MGIIKKQAIQSSIYTYIGVGLGFANSAILLPHLISSEQIGLLSLLNSLTNILAAVSALGLPLMTLRLFPRFRNPDQSHGGFFAFMILMTLAGVVMGTVILLSMDHLLLSSRNMARNYEPFMYACIGLFILRLIFKNFDAFIRMLYNTVLGAFTENFLLKFAISLALAVFWLIGGYDFLYLFIIYTLALGIPGIISIIYILAKGEWNLQISRFTSSNLATRTEVFSLGIFGWLGSLGAIIVLEIDRVMISNMLGLAENGIYTTAFFFGLFISLPARGVRRVAAVVLADAWKEDNIKSIGQIYQKSALNQFLFGLYLFLGVWLNVDYVFQVIPPEYSAGKYVILFIGLGQLFEMATGVNYEVITTSKHYHFSTYFNAVLILLTVGLNYVLIPTWGIVGAAVATALALILVNTGRSVFIYLKFGLVPIRWKMLINLGIGLLCFLLITYLIPKHTNPFMGILINGSIITFLYWIMAYVLSISTDVNKTVHQVIEKLKGRF